jgi:DNA-binding NtrC family response regulator
MMEQTSSESRSSSRPQTGNEMILIVDDDPSITASLGLLLKQAGYRSQTASTPAEALLRLETPNIALVLQDMNFSRRTTGEEGLELLDDIRRRRPSVPVILITAWGSISLAVKGMKAGASDFVTKPWSNQQLLQSIETVLGLAAVGRDASKSKVSRDDLDERYDFSNLIGRDPKLLKVLEVIGRVSATDASVLITGESGTGKELIAEALHRNSRRRGGPFVKVNLGGIPSSLFESEMFGHVKGAFTDARSDRKGRFELANGGSVFLDEIGELDLSSQVKMLRVLQDRRYEVLGSSATRTLDIRVISATNRNLAELVDKGSFREDLLYRLNLISVHLPPLRERREDVPLLAAQFLQTMAQIYRRDKMAISESALAWLKNQLWPGNIRQLRQLIERAVLVTTRETLEIEGFGLAEGMEPKEVRRDPLPNVGSMTMDEIEKAMILKCLQYHKGNVSKVADSLGLSRGALYRRFEKYGVKP